MIKLNQLVLKFVPINYLKYLKDNMDTKINVIKNSNICLESPLQESHWEQAD